MSLTPRQAHAVTLKKKGLSQREIAERMGVSRRTVRGLLERSSHSDDAVQEAMDAFGLDTIPKEIWLKNKQYSVKVRPEALDFTARVESALQNIPPAPPVDRPLLVLEDMMTLYPIFDAHLGLRAHAEISGTEMNLKKGVERLVNAFSRAMVGSPHSHRAVIAIGGDLTHQTDDMNRTRGHGHILDVDGKNVFTVDESLEAVSHMIDLALTQHQVVEVYGVPGNHDPQNYETIMIGLREWYRGHNRVTIHFKPGYLEVIEHGEVAIYIHHGDKRTPKDLAMVCAAKFKETWGRTDYRLLLTGHLHHLKLEEFPGIYWMQMPAITCADAYAANGYFSHSALIAITFDMASEVEQKKVIIK